MTLFLDKAFTVFLITFSVVIQIECSSNLVSVPKCRIGGRQSIVQCRVPTWHPNLLEDHRINKSAVKKLHIYFGEKSTQLTKHHLRGLKNLESLVVVGLCTKKPRIKWCKTPAGLSAIEIDAFDATPRLRSLTLRVHPLKNFNAIRKLRQLKYLFFQWMRSNNEFNASIFDNTRGSLKTVLLWYIPLKVIGPKHFKDMINLQKLEIVAAKTLTIQTGSISNLAKLKSLYLGSYIGNSKFTIERSAISNLTKLEHVSFNLIQRVSGPIHSSCSGRFNILTLSSSRSSSAIFDYCPQLLSCAKCGKNPHRYPQETVFMKPQMSKGASENTLLPPYDTIPILNTSRVSIYNPYIPYPFDMMRQMPLLKSFTVEYEIRRYPVKTWMFTRFHDNPFSRLPSTARLNEIRITLKHCDCQFLEIIDWFKTNPRFEANKSVNDVLKVDCQIIDGVCSDDGGDHPRQFIKWTNLTLLTEKLRPICKVFGRRTRHIRKVLPSECRCMNLELCESKRNKSLTIVAFLLMSVSFMAVIVVG